MKDMLCKSVVVGIIVLFVGVSVSSAISVDGNEIIVNINGEDCKECNKVIKSDLVIVERLLNRVEVSSKLLLVLSKYHPEIREKCDELSNIIDTIDWDFPIICTILESIWNQLLQIGKIIEDLLHKYEDNLVISSIIYSFYMFVWTPIAWPVGFLGYNLGCWDYTP